MSAINERNRQRRGESHNSKEARRISYKISASILHEKANKEKYSNPIQKTKGPRQQIIDYVNMMEMLGMSPSNEEIIEYMQKIMKNTDRDYVQNLIDQVRTPTIIAYHIARSSNVSEAIKDIVNKYPDINRLKIVKIIRKYKVNPNCLTKTEKAQVKEAVSKISKELNIENSRNDAGEDR